MAADTAVGRIRGQGVSGGDSTVSISWKQSAGLAKLWPRAVHTSSEMFGQKLARPALGRLVLWLLLAGEMGQHLGGWLRWRERESGCLPVPCGWLVEWMVCVY